MGYWQGYYIYHAPSIFIKTHWLLLPPCAALQSLLLAFFAPHAYFFSFSQLPWLSVYVAMIACAPTARCSPQTACSLSHCFVLNLQQLLSTSFPEAIWNGWMCVVWHVAWNQGRLSQHVSSWAHVQCRQLSFWQFIQHWHLFVFLHKVAFWRQGDWLKRTEEYQWYSSMWCNILVGTVTQHARGKELWLSVPHDSLACDVEVCRGIKIFWRLHLEWKWCYEANTVMHPRFTVAFLHHSGHHIWYHIGCPMHFIVDFLLTIDVHPDWKDNTWL